MSHRLHQLITRGVRERELRLNKICARIKIMNTEPFPKKYITNGIFIIILIILLIWFINYWHTGTIIITSNDPNDSITLFEFSGNKNSSSPKTFKGRDKLVVKVHTGRYIASVQGNSVATTQYIYLNSHRTLSYSINPINTTGAEPVAYQDAEDIAADNNELLYLNVGDNHLYKIDSQNNLSVINSSEQFQSVKWADTGFGVAQTAGGILYKISGGALSALGAPFSYSTSRTSYAVSPSRQIYVSNGADIYAIGQNGKFKKIYAATSSKPILAAAANAVAVADAPTDIGDRVKPVLVIVSPDGKVIKKAIEAHRLSWSPDGRSLLNFTDESIYDSTLRKIATLPTPVPIGSADWLDNDRLFYSTADQLWLFDIQAERSQLVANAPLGGIIISLSTSSDSSYLYLVAEQSPTSSGAAVKRIGLKNQLIASSIFQLQSILPTTFGQCSLSLINFTGPTITTQSAQCQTAARSELQARGFDLTKLKVEVSQ